MQGMAAKFWFWFAIPLAETLYLSPHLPDPSSIPYPLSGMKGLPPPFVLDLRRPADHMYRIRLSALQPRIAFPKLFQLPLQCI
jgi:hypothetical protein